MLDGTGRIRVDEDVLTLTPLSALLVEPESLRQVFNDTDADTLLAVAGAPPEAANTLEMTPELLEWMYPTGPKPCRPARRRSGRLSPAVGCGRRPSPGDGYLPARASGRLTRCADGVKAPVYVHDLTADARE